MPARPTANLILACRSFALQIVDAYERRLRIKPPSVERLRPTIEERQFAYLTFLPQREFPRVSALDVYKNDDAALSPLRHRIVLVGGNRTRWPSDNPNPPVIDMLDYFHGPDGSMAGMYFQANYVEGLLDDRVQSPVPRWLAALIDVLLATAIILAINLLDGAARVLTVVALIVFPVIIAYTAMVTLGYCFDFVLPILLSLLHPALEKYLDLPEHLFRRHSHA
jgi:CHASE2 domain-containing sensor protein